MTHHTVTEDQLTDYVEQQRHTWSSFAVSSSVGREVKRLDYSIGQVSPIYRVTCGDRQIYVGTLKETAVREYNALP